MNKFHNLDIYKQVSLMDMLGKFKEEEEELVEAIINQDRENQKEEICDCIQVLYGIAYTLGINIDECIKKHNEKLLSKGYKFI